MITILKIGTDWRITSYKHGLELRRWVPTRRTEPVEGPAESKGPNGTPEREDGPTGHWRIQGWYTSLPGALRGLWKIAHREVALRDVREVHAAYEKAVARLIAHAEATDQ